VSAENYNRQNPSPRYRELLRLYEQMHREGSAERQKKAEDTFAGGSLRPHLHEIRALVQRTSAKTLLDYGSGKGTLYRQKNIRLKSGEVIPSVAEYLRVQEIACFDPGVPEYAEFPAGQFDAVVSTDVLEHCPEEDIPWIVGEMFAKAKKFVFANVASYPADKVLPNGENAHCTQSPPAWWEGVLEKISAQYPSVLYQFDITQKHHGLLNKIRGRRWTITPIVNFSV
jgi:hypothetical protein